MGSGKFRPVALAAVVALLFAGALMLALVGPGAQSAAAQTTATPAGTSDGGLRTVITGTTGTPGPASTATIEVLGTATPVPTAGTATVTATATASSGTAVTSTMAFNGAGPVPTGAGVRTITVIGEGRATAEPDTANANIGVEVVTGTVKGATTQARELMDAVLQALKDAGIAERDIQTSGFNIFAERNFPNQGQPGATETVRYHVNNQVNVVIRDLDTIGNVLDVAIEAGANQIYGVNFRVSSPVIAEEQAYTAALTDAHRRAELLATRAGLEIGAVSSISEVLGTNPVFSTREVQAQAGMGGGGGGPIQTGQLEIMRQLEVVFYLQ